VREQRAVAWLKAIKPGLPLVRPGLMLSPLASGTILLKWGEVKTERIYRLTIRLTPGSGPRLSEVDEFVFRISDIQAAFDHDLGEPLFPNDPETYWPQWQDPKPLPPTLWQELKLPSSRKSSR
jgi:hypothetical protein